MTPAMDESYGSDWKWRVTHELDDHGMISGQCDEVVFPTCPKGLSNLSVGTAGNTANDHTNQVGLRALPRVISENINRGSREKGQECGRPLDW